MSRRRSEAIDGKTDARRGDANQAVIYDAFISYSHAWDKGIAKAFQSALQGFDRPWYRPRSLKLFRDETNLAASPHLWREIEQGLSRSRWLVVMASPSAAASPWVRQEIRWWLTHRSVDTLLIGWTDGTLVWDDSRTSFDWSRTDALPCEEMDGIFDQEPRWVDLRWLHSPEQASAADPRLVECVAEFAAPITGRSKDEVIGDHVRRHSRTMRLVWSTVAVLIALLLVALAGGVTAYTQRNTARSQTLVALSRQLVAEASSIRDTQPDLARQLLVQAYRLAPTAEATGALVDSGSLPRVIHGKGDVRGVAYSSEGLLAVADDQVRLYDLATGALRASLEDLDGSVATVAFSPDGRLLAVGDADGGVRLLDVTSADSPRTLGAVSAAADGTNELVFAPDGKLLVLARAGGSVLDVQDPSRPRSLGSLPPDTIAASPTGALILTEARASAVLGLWILSGSARLTRAATVTSPSDGVFATDGRAAFSANGRTLAVGGGDNRVRLWDIDDPTRPAIRSDLNAQGRDGVSSMEFSLDGTVLAVGGSDGVITLWDVSDPFRPRSGARLTGYPAFASVFGLAFGPDGQTLASIAGNREKLAPDAQIPPENTVRLWAVSGIDRTSTVTTLPVKGSFPPSFSADSHLLAAGGSPTTVWRMNDSTGPHLAATVESFNAGGQAAAFGPDGHTLFSGLPVVAWDIADSAAPRKLTSQATRSLGAQGISLNPALPLLATGAGPMAPEQVELGTVQLWDVDNRTRPILVDTLDGTMADRQAISFSPDGGLLAAPTDAGAVRLWNVARNIRPTVAADIAMVRGKATALVFGPRSRTLLVGDDRGAITSWDVSRPGQPSRRATAARHAGTITGLAYHPDGALAASAATDGGIRLWDVSDPDRLVEIASLSSGGLYPQATLAFSPDGSLLAVSGDRGTRLWSVDRVAILRRLCAESPRITREQWHQYLPNRAYDPPCA
ncbi:toll/interleukin-1 receptor domain-containing protein [Streptomyces scopuliridis]|uniref:toll/interleukin-1 receptor domain-containing protein n=1 Tax=Streptomyces scopuliridis TaxID=452529 RepID=UPI0036752211